MNVSLMRNENKFPINYIAENTRICHNREGYFLISENTPNDEMRISALTTVQNALTRGHHSVFECLHFEWYVRNISRAASHQIVRHRMATYLQQSQRYVNYKESDEFWENMVKPDFSYILKKEEAIPEDLTNADNTFIKIMSQIKIAYNTLLDLGVNPEDARAILPQCSPTTLKIGMNLREFLFNFYPMRTAKGAQAEIKELAHEMMNALKEKYSKDEQFIEFLTEVYPEWLNKQKSVRTEWMS